MNRRECQAVAAPAPNAFLLQNWVFIAGDRGVRTCSPAQSFKQVSRSKQNPRSPSSTSVPSNLELRYPCCYALWNTKLSPVGSGLHSHWAKARRKY